MQRPGDKQILGAGVAVPCSWGLRVSVWIPRRAQGSPVGRTCQVMESSECAPGGEEAWGEGPDLPPTAVALRRGRGVRPVLQAPDTVLGAGPLKEVTQQHPHGLTAEPRLQALPHCRALHSLPCGPSHRPSVCRQPLFPDAVPAAEVSPTAPQAGSSDHRAGLTAVKTAARVRFRHGLSVCWAFPLQCWAWLCTHPRVFGLWRATLSSARSQGRPRWRAAGVLWLGLGRGTCWSRRGKDTCYPQGKSGRSTPSRGSPPPHRGAHLGHSAPCGVEGTCAGAWAGASRRGGCVTMLEARGLPRGLQTHLWL